MKIIILCLSMFYIFGLCSSLSAQSSFDWYTTIVAHHPSGQLDTAIIGVDISGGIGYQAGLDKIDTSFNYPISIRSYDTVVASQFSTCPANMQTDIRSIRKQLVFPLYIKSDSFPSPEFLQNQYAIDSVTGIYYDTSQLYYNDGKWELTRVQFFSFGGYIDDMDGTFKWIKSKSGIHGSADGDIGFIYEQNPSAYLWGSCANGEKVIKLEVHLEFENLVGIGNVSSSLQALTIAILPGKINISSKKPKPFNYQLYAVDGRQIISGTFQGQEESINLPYTPSGIYLLSVFINQSHYTYKVFIP